MFRGAAGTTASSWFADHYHIMVRKAYHTFLFNLHISVFYKNRNTETNEFFILFIWCVLFAMSLGVLSWLLVRAGQHMMKDLTQKRSPVLTGCELLSFSFIIFLFFGQNHSCKFPFSLCSLQFASLNNDPVKGTGDLV